MSFVKPELHHRRSFSRKSEKRRKRKASIDDPVIAPPDTSSPSTSQPLTAGTSDSALPSSSQSPTGPSLSRRRSKPSDENEEDTPNKRRKKDPEFWWEITRDTTVLKPLPSSSGEVSRSKGWATTNSSSSDEDIREEFVAMEDINMEYVKVPEKQRNELFEGIDAAVEDEFILPIQGEALKELFDVSYDQRQLYTDWQQEGMGVLEDEEDEGVEADKSDTPKPNEEASEDKDSQNDESSGKEKAEAKTEEPENAAEDKENKDKNAEPEAPKNPPKELSIPKLKDALVTLRAGVGKFSLRIKEAQDKKIVPDTEIKPKRSSTYRAMLMHRDSNHCVITHGRDSLIAAHILPFTIASLARSHRFWSLLRLMLGPKACDQLFERYGYKTTRHHQGNKGINSPENGWILRYDLDGAFARMECYLEPIPDEPNKYTFKWLQEPRERLRMSVYHSDEKRQDELLKSGEIIDLSPVESPDSQNIPNQSSPINRAIPPPSRALLQMQAAIHKLAHKFQGQADIFNTRSHPDWDSDSVSSINEESEAHEKARQHELAQPLNPDNHMYFCGNKVEEWLRSVSPESPERAGTKRKRSELEDEEQTEAQPQTVEPTTVVEQDSRPTKRTKTSHITQPQRGSRKLANITNIKVSAAIPETGLLSPDFTNKSETSPEEKGRTRRYFARECKRTALTFHPALDRAASEYTTIKIKRRSHIATVHTTGATNGVGKGRVTSGGAGSRKRKRA